MVKKLLFITLLISSLGYGQSLELGIGAQGNLNWLKGNESFTTLTLDKAPYFDTVYFRFDDTKMDVSFSIPLFLRFRTKFGLWLDLNYSTEKLTTRVSGTSNYSENYLNDYTYYSMYNAWQTDGSNLTEQEFYDTYYDIFYQNEKDEWEEDVSYLEITKYNNFEFNVGYTFLRTKKIRPFISLGLNWYNRVWINHYQELHYNTEWVNEYSTIYKTIPRMNSNIFLLNLGVGVELFNMQLGLKARQSVGYIQEYEFYDQLKNEAGFFTSDLYEHITSFSFYMKYNLFNFNLRSKEDRKKLKDDELKVLGDFKEKNKIIKLGIGIDLPIYTNINSHTDKYGWGRDSIFISDYDSNMFFIEKLFLYNDKNEVQVNQGTGLLDTNNVLTIVGLGRIKRIHQLPRVSFKMEVEPIKYFSYETNINYQYAEFDTEAKYYQSSYDWDNSEESEVMRSLVLRQSFHNISLGQKLNFKYDVSPGMYVGINGGVNFNFMLPGKFKYTEMGYNDNELLEEFDKWHLRGDNSKAWNQFSPDDFYSDYSMFTAEFDDVGDLITSDVTDENRMSTFGQRFWISWTAGLDFYYDKLKISPYVEGKISDINFMYQDYFSVGLGFTYYLRK